MRLRYLFGLIAAVLVSPFLLFWAWSAIESARLDRAFDALEARHEPLDIAEFEPKPTTDEQRQASHYYKQATTLIVDLRPRWLTETGKIIEEFCASSDPVTRQGREASLKSLEDRYKRAFELLDRATPLQANGWDPADKPPRNSLEAYLPNELAQLNIARVARLACSGNGEAAGNALLASLRVRRVLPREAAPPVPTGHSLQLVLSTGASTGVLEKLQREYQQMDDGARLESALLAARAQWLYFTEPGVFSDSPPGFSSRRMTPFEAIAVRLSRPARDHAAVRELREFDEALAAAAVPWPQKLDEAARLQRKYPRPTSRGSAVMNVLNPLGAHVANAQMQFRIPVVAESLARTRASIAALAVARWRADHHDALPKALHDLEREYLPGPLVDPYSGVELKYVTNGNSYRIYSVGANRRDDGGVWEQRSDLQFSRRGDPLDLGIAASAPPKLP